MFSNSRRTHLFQAQSASVLFSTLSQGPTSSHSSKEYGKRHRDTEREKDLLPVSKDCRKKSAIHCSFTWTEQGSFLRTLRHLTTKLPSLNLFFIFVFTHKMFSFFNRFRFKPALHRYTEQYCWEDALFIDIKKKKTASPVQRFAYLFRYLAGCFTHCTQPKALLPQTMNQVQRCPDFKCNMLLFIFLFGGISFDFDWKDNGLSSVLYTLFVRVMLQNSAIRLIYSLSK